MTTGRVESVAARLCLVQPRPGGAAWCLVHTNPVERGRLVCMVAAPVVDLIVELLAAAPCPEESLEDVEAGGADLCRDGSASVES